MGGKNFMAKTVTAGNSSKNNSAMALSDDDLGSVGGGYDTMTVLNHKVYRGVDEFGDIFYTTNKSLVKKMDTSGDKKIDTPFNKSFAEKALMANGVVYEDLANN